MNLFNWHTPNHFNPLLEPVCRQAGPFQQPLRKADFKNLFNWHTPNHFVMIVNYTNSWFFTATILNWQPLLKNDGNKNMIIDALRFLIKENRIVLFGFVIMPNHLHLVWNTKEGLEKYLTQGSLLRFTANSMIKELKISEPLALELFRVDAADRTIQIWERNPLSTEIFTDKVMEQKLN